MVLRDCGAADDKSALLEVEWLKLDPGLPLDR